MMPVTTKLTLVFALLCGKVTSFEPLGGRIFYRKSDSSPIFEITVAFSQVEGRPLVSLTLNDIRPTLLHPQRTAYIGYQIDESDPSLVRLDWGSQDDLRRRFLNSIYPASQNPDDLQTLRLVEHVHSGGTVEEWIEVQLGGSPIPFELTEERSDGVFGRHLLDFCYVASS